MYTDKLSDRFRGSNDVLWGLQMFLTNRMLLYLFVYSVLILENVYSTPILLANLIINFIIWLGLRVSDKLKDGTVVSEASRWQWIHGWEGLYCCALAKAAKTMKQNKRILLTAKPQCKDDTFQLNLDFFGRGVLLS